MLVLVRDLNQQNDFCLLTSDFCFLSPDSLQVKKLFQVVFQTALFIFGLFITVIF
jgi:hypothetical protein